MESVSTTMLAGILWKNFGQPILDSAKNKYGDKVLEGLKNRLPFRGRENEIIEAKIIEAIDSKVITNENTFIKFLENNDNFIQALVKLQEIKSSKEIINSFKNINKSSIIINGNNKKILDSFDRVSESQIEI